MYAEQHLSLNFDWTCLEEEEQEEDEEEEEEETVTVTVTVISEILPYI